MTSLFKTLRILLTVAALGMVAAPHAHAQDTSATANEAQAVGAGDENGIQTLEDILARQRGELTEPTVRDLGDTPFSGNSPGSLATQGSASDSDFWSAIRQGRTDVVTTTARGPGSTLLVQEEGEDWLALRNGPLVTYSAYALVGIIVLLAIFMTLKGRMRVEGGMSGVKVRRFNFLERFGHWLLAISFIVLAVSGFSVLFGREALVPLIDWANASINGDAADPNAGNDWFKNTFVPWLAIAKPLHNSVSWAFMAALILIFFLWVLHNIPTWTDVKWLAKGGGIIGNAHPDAKKFNAGQKIVFWSVVLMGASISASGVMLLFPYEVPMFGETFGAINVAAEKVGQPMNLETNLSPIEEMQYAALWHTIVATALTVIVIAHIYIGSIGMQGAFAAMGSGKVDLNWAKEHHNLWVAKLRRKGELTEQDEGVVHTHPAKRGTTTPAE